jgi:hypothetical protein
MAGRRVFKKKEKGRFFNIKINGRSLILLMHAGWEMKWSMKT